MKKVTLLSSLIISFFLTTHIMHAQNIRFGVKAGGNTSKWGGKEVMNDIKSRVGFNAGVTFDLDFTDHVALLSGVEFVQKGFKDQEGYSVTSANPLYIQLPFHFGYKFNLSSSNSLKLVLHGGPYLGYGIGGKLKSDDRFIDGEKAFDSDMGFRRVDFGIGIGGMLEYENWFADLGYEWGFVKPYKDYKANNRSISFVVGYKF